MSNDLEYDDAGNPVPKQTSEEEKEDEWYCVRKIVKYGCLFFIVLFVVLTFSFLIPTYNNVDELEDRYEKLSIVCDDGNNCTYDYWEFGSSPPKCRNLNVPSSLASACEDGCIISDTGVCDGTGKCTGACAGQCYDVDTEGNDVSLCPNITLNADFEFSECSDPLTTDCSDGVCFYYIPDLSACGLPAFSLYDNFPTDDDWGRSACLSILDQTADNVKCLTASAYIIVGEGTTVGCVFKYKCAAPEFTPLFP